LAANYFLYNLLDEHIILIILFTLISPTNYMKALIYQTKRTGSWPTGICNF